MNKSRKNGAASFANAVSRESEAGNKVLGARYSPLGTGQIADDLVPICRLEGYVLSGMLDTRCKMQVDRYLVLNARYRMADFLNRKGRRDNMSSAKKKYKYLRSILLLCDLSG